MFHYYLCLHSSDFFVALGMKMQHITPTMPECISYMLGFTTRKNTQCICVV